MTDIFNNIIIITDKFDVNSMEVVAVSEVCLEKTRDDKQHQQL
jgi:hypothetical protein